MARTQAWAKGPDGQDLIRNQFKSFNLQPLEVVLATDQAPKRENSKTGCVQECCRFEYRSNYQCNTEAHSSTRIKDAGIAIRHSRGYIISILQGLEVGWRGWKRCVHRQEIIKMVQFRPKITKIKVSTFWMSGKSTDSRRRPMPACSRVSFKQSRLSFCDIWPR